MRFFKKKYTVLDIIFILIGGKFYMDWLLPTNPTSKNIVWRLMMSPLKSTYTAKDYNSRYWSCYSLIITHIVLFFVFHFTGTELPVNIFVNIYPILVNTYILLKLKKVIDHKKNFFNK